MQRFLTGEYWTAKRLTIATAVVLLFAVALINANKPADAGADAAVCAPPWNRFEVSYALGSDAQGSDRPIDHLQDFADCLIDNEPIVTKCGFTIKPGNLNFSDMRQLQECGNKLYD